MKLEYYKCSRCKKLGHNKLTCKGGIYVKYKKYDNRDGRRNRAL